MREGARGQSENQVKAGAHGHGFFLTCWCTLCRERIAAVKQLRKELKEAGQRSEGPS